MLAELEETGISQSKSGDKQSQKGQSLQRDAETIRLGKAPSNSSRLVRAGCSLQAATPGRDLLREIQDSAFPL